MNDKIGELLQTLADKLGVTIDHLWAVLVAQVKNQIVENVIWYLVLLAYTVVLMIGRPQLFRWLKKQDEYSEWPVWVGFIGAGVAVIGWAVAADGISTFLAMFNNPEYVALKNVLGMLGGE